MPIRPSTADPRARRRLRSLPALCMVVGAGVCTGLALVTFSLHLGFRPVLTGSMRPTYGPGALLVTRPVPVGQIRPGMILVFAPPGRHVQFAHRVVTVTGTPSHPTITTKGDANPAPDPWHAQLTSSSVPEVMVAVPWAGGLLTGMRGAVATALVILGGVVTAVAGGRWILRPTGRALPA